MHVRALSFLPARNDALLDDNRGMTLTPTTALHRFVEASRAGAGAVAVHDLKADLLVQAAAIDAVIAALRADPALLASFADAIDTLLSARRHRFLYAETGVLEPTSFSRTLRSRLGSRLLPHVADAGLLRDLFGSTFQSDADIAAVEAVPVESWATLFQLVTSSTAFVAGASQSARECDAAIAMLAARAAGLAVDPDRVRYDHAVRGSEAANEADVLELPAAARRWINAHAQDPHESPKELLKKLATAQDAVETLRKAVPLHGTSLALTHSLHAAHQTLERLRDLVLIRAALDDEERAARCATLFVELVGAQRTEQSLRHVFSQVADDVALQITEHASETGEHYVTDDRPQWWHMLRVAGGAGVIVGAMALLKVFIAQAHLAPLWETLAICLNYGLGFVLIHLLHFTVATKQPAMTAALLAARLDQEDATPASAARLADLIVRTVRTQVVAIVGNVALAVPTALLILFAFRAATGQSPVPEAKAQHMLAELHPWASWALCTRRSRACACSCRASSAATTTTCACSAASARGWRCIPYCSACWGMHARLGSPATSGTTWARCWATCRSASCWAASASSAFSPACRSTSATWPSRPPTRRTRWAPCKATSPSRPRRWRSSAWCWSGPSTSRSATASRSPPRSARATRATSARGWCCGWSSSA